MRKFIIITIYVYIAFASYSANAVIIYEEWTANVLSVTNNSIDSSAQDVVSNGYSIGDIVTWSVIYNSAPSDHSTRYSDGSNGIAEKGVGDDTLNTLFCLDKRYNPNCGSSLKDDGVIALFDSTSNIFGIYNALFDYLGVGEIVYDYFDFNNDTRIFRVTPSHDFTQYDYYSDEFNINADNRASIPGGAGYAQLFYKKTGGDIFVSRIGFGNISITSSIISNPTPIPEPSTIYLIEFAIVISMKRKLLPTLRTISACVDTDTNTRNDI